MLYAVLFTDNIDVAGPIRDRYMSSHLSFLEDHRAQITAAGPLVGACGKTEGGLWTVVADSEEDVDALVRKDPFWPTGLRQDVRILAWKQVFAGGKRLA